MKQLITKILRKTTLYYFALKFYYATNYIYFNLFFTIVFYIYLVSSFYCTPSKLAVLLSAEESTTTLKLLLPTISNINDFFQYKTIIFGKSSLITKNLNADFITCQKVVDIYNNTITLKQDYQPAQSIYSYFPLEDNISYSNYDSAPWLPILEKQLDFNPLFKVTVNEIEKTPLHSTVILDDNMPFESPVELTIRKPVEKNNILIPMEPLTEITKDKFMSIYGPSYNGIRHYDEDMIFQLHLTIVDHVKHLLYNYDNITNKEAIVIIRDIVHQQLIAKHILINLTIKELQNTNHLINLLIHEMGINSIITYDDDSFILKQIIIALIIETISNIEQTTTEHYYENPSLCDAVVKVTLTRFL